MSAITALMNICFFYRIYPCYIAICSLVHNEPVYVDIAQVEIAGIIITISNTKICSAIFFPVRFVT